MALSDYESYEEGSKEVCGVLFEIHKTSLHILDITKIANNYSYPYEAIIKTLPDIDNLIDYLFFETSFRDFKIIIEHKIYGKRHVMYCVIGWDSGYFSGIGYYDHNHYPTPEKYLKHLCVLKKKILKSED